MRVLHVIPSLGPLRGGPSYMMQTMARGLGQAGLEVHVAATDDNGAGRLNVPLGEPIRQDGVTFWYFPRQTRFYIASWPLTRWLARHVTDYDLLHIHALFCYPPEAAAFAAARRQVPYVIRPLGTLNRWGMQQRRPWLKRLSFCLIESRVLHGASAIHYTSQQERLEAGELGVDQRSAVIPHGLDLTPFQHLRATGWLAERAPHLADRTIVLFLSRLDPKKGLDLLLPAFADLRHRHPRVGLVLAGSGDAEFVAGLRREAARLDIERDIYWAGFLSGDEKLAALADADVFVLPSYSENFGMAVVEAMASGKPVVVSDQVAIHREIADGEAGLVVPGEVEALAAALTRLVADPRLRRRLAENGRRLAQEKFSVERMVAQLRDLYAEILDEGDSTRDTLEPRIEIPV